MKYDVGVFLKVLVLFYRRCSQFPARPASNCAHVCARHPRHRNQHSRLRSSVVLYITSVRHHIFASFHFSFRFFPHPPPDRGLARVLLAVIIPSYGAALAERLHRHCPFVHLLNALPTSLCPSLLRTAHKGESLLETNCTVVSQNLGKDVTRSCVCGHVSKLCLYRF